MFIEAGDKLEAVNRLSRVAGGPPEQLGPGSKERKSVLVTLGVALNVPSEALAYSKPRLGGVLARSLGVPWGEDCWSTGSTITLLGLNRLLKGAEDRFGSPSNDPSAAFSRVWERASLPLTPMERDAEFGSDQERQPEEEAVAMCLVIEAVLPKVFVGKRCIEEMRLSGSRNWAQSEWPGWYFEHIGLANCIGHLGGGPGPTPGNTVFDYRLNFTWDFKTHSDAEDEAILNDGGAVEWAVAHGGLGFVVLSGRSEFDADFKEWHDNYKVVHGKPPRKRTKERKYIRPMKSQFTPLRVDGFFFSDSGSFESAVEAGAIKRFDQPPQPSGEPRKPKYTLKMRKAADWQIVSWPLGRPSSDFVWTPRPNPG